VGRQTMGLIVGRAPSTSRKKRADDVEDESQYFKM